MSRTRVHNFATFSLDGFATGDRVKSRITLSVMRAIGFTVWMFAPATATR